MVHAEARLAELGITITPPAAPLGAYAPVEIALIAEVEG